MSCWIPDKRMIVGRTKKKALVTVCMNCGAYFVPHFNYISKKYEVTFSLLSPRFVDTFENIELEDRTDLEMFLNKIVDKKEIEENNKRIKKINKKFFKQQKRAIKRFGKYEIPIATIDEGDKYFGVDVKKIKEDMTYWELIVNLWNENNEEKTPKNLLKPYYRNFLESIDTATFGIEKHLEGGECYTKCDQERIPHFYYRVSTSEEFCILFEKAEYLEPKPRKLTQKELDVLVKFLSRKRRFGSGWKDGVSLWNDQNWEYNEHAPNWFPKYKKIEENIKMPDYTKLNDTF